RRRRAFLAAGIALGLAAIGTFGGIYETRIARTVSAQARRRAAAVRATEGAGFSDARTRVAMFTKAIEIDPTWGEAHAELARNYMRVGRHSSRPEPATENLERAIVPMDTAVRLAPADPELLNARAYLRH